jgi:hypothetical protein
MLVYIAAAASGTSADCEVAVVGAGPGGAYAAWRVASAQPDDTVCLFEQGSRAGGRVHSLRGQGPRGDLVVEAGAYRFAPNETCVQFLNSTYCVHTPLTAHLIQGALKLPTASYNPTPGEWDHGLQKIVDAEGHDAGYLTFVEALLASPPANLAIHFGHELASISPASSEAPTLAPLVLSFRHGASFTARRLVLNVPQRPLLRLLANSPALISPSTPWPAPLTRPIAYPIVKLCERTPRAARACELCGAGAQMPPHRPSARAATSSSHAQPLSRPSSASRLAFRCLSHAMAIAPRLRPV